MERSTPRPSSPMPARTAELNRSISQENPNLEFGSSPETSQMAYKVRSEMVQKKAEARKHAVDSDTAEDNESVDIANHEFKEKDNVAVSAAVDMVQACAICLQEPDQPRQLVCMHRFCTDCFESWERNQENVRRSVTCPVCRAPAIDLIKASCLHCEMPFKVGEKTEPIVCVWTEYPVFSWFFETTEYRVVHHLHIACKYELQYRGTQQDIEGKKYACPRHTHVWHTTPKSVRDDLAPANALSVPADEMLAIKKREEEEKERIKMRRLLGHPV